MLTDMKKDYLAKPCFEGQIMNSKATQSDGNSIRPSNFLWVFIAQGRKVGNNTRRRKFFAFSQLLGVALHSKLHQEY